MTVIVKVICRNKEEAESIKENIRETLVNCPFKINSSCEVKSGGKVQRE